MIEYVLNAKALETSTTDEMTFIEEARRCVIDSMKYEKPHNNGEIHFKRFNAFHNTILQKLKKNIDKPSEFMQYFKENFI